MSVAELRERLGLTATELARLLGCSVRNVWRLEAGAKPSGSTAMLLGWLEAAAGLELLGPRWAVGELEAVWRRVLVVAEVAATRERHSPTPELLQDTNQGKTP